MHMHLHVFGNLIINKFGKNPRHHCGYHAKAWRVIINNSSSDLNSKLFPVNQLELISIILDLMKMIGKNSKNLPPNGDLMMFHNGLRWFIYIKWFKNHPWKHRLKVIWRVKNSASSLGPQQLGTYLAMGRFIVQGGPLLVVFGVK